MWRRSKHLPHCLILTNASPIAWLVHGVRRCDFGDYRIGQRQQIKMVFDRRYSSIDLKFTAVYALSTHRQCHGSADAAPCEPIGWVLQKVPDGTRLRRFWGKKWAILSNENECRTFFWSKQLQIMWLAHCIVCMQLARIAGSTLSQHLGFRFPNIKSNSSVLLFQLSHCLSKYICDWRKGHCLT